MRSGKLVLELRAPTLGEAVVANARGTLTGGVTENLAVVLAELCPSAAVEAAVQELVALSVSSEKAASFTTHNKERVRAIGESLVGSFGEMQAVSYTFRKLCGRMPTARFILRDWHDLGIAWNGVDEWQY